MTNSRFDIALALNDGILNPLVVARALLAVIEDAHQSGLDERALYEDPAVRLAVHRLAFLTSQDELVYDFRVYTALYTKCLELREENSDD